MHIGNIFLEIRDSEPKEKKTELYGVVSHQRKNEFHLKLAIHLSFLAFWHVCALFRELLREIANQSLYTSHNIADFVHLWFFEKLDEKLSLSLLWHFVKLPTVWRERRNAIWEKWLARWFTKCHLYTYHFSHFANIFSRCCQFDDKCIASFTTGLAPQQVY